MLGEFVGEYEKYVINEDGSMCLYFTSFGADTYQAKQTVSALKAALASGKKRIKVTVDTYKEKRSLSANAYFWKLCGEVAKALSLSLIPI